MTAPAIPADSVWGIQWEVPVLPDNDPSIPAQPQQPDEQWSDDPEGPWALYNEAITQWYADIVALAALHQEWWRPTVTTYTSETAARDDLVGKTEINNGNPFARNTQLVWSPPAVWTPVE